jgi:hypothetical protein
MLCYSQLNCQLIDIPKLVVHGVHKKGEWLVSFYGQWVPTYQKYDARKEAKEAIWNALVASWLEHNHVAW